MGRPRLKRSIAIFTGNRAEYGLLYPIIKAVAAHPRLTYHLLVSGAHLEKDFGTTRSEIKKDGFRIAEEINLKVKDDTLASTAHAIGQGVVNISRVLAKLKPDFLVVYADRFETLAAAVAGTQMVIPTAHVEGGDMTDGGALDDSVRHAITKLSHLHFTTNTLATERILKLGEEPWRVHTVGFPLIDLVVAGQYASEVEVTARLSVDLTKPLILFTQHSVTSEFGQARAQIQPVLRALERLAREGVQVIITYPNNDAGGRSMIAEISKLAKKQTKNIQVMPSLGRWLYHGVLNMCRRQGACVGNSSSGIKETPAFGVPTVNIGFRQRGRLRSTNVIDCDYATESVVAACKKALFDTDFRTACAACENPYGSGGTGEKIADILASVAIDARLIQKMMTY